MTTFTFIFSDKNDNCFRARIRYELEKERYNIYGVTYCEILDEIPPSSDLQTDIEESIAIYENVKDVRLRCKVGYSQRLQQASRFRLMNPELEIFETL